MGDNVGDVAGMSADLFGSFAESTCAALVIGSNSITSPEGIIDVSTNISILYIPALGILVSIAVSYLICEGENIKHKHEVEGSLKNQLKYSTAGLVPLLAIAAYVCNPEFRIILNDGTTLDRTALHILLCIIAGAFAGLCIGIYTEMMTSFTYNPVRELAEACRTSAATNVIYGLALGYLSCGVPVIALCFVCFLSHTLLGFYGVALGALGMLSNLPICLAIDGYGPISDNAGGIAEMAELPAEVRVSTDVLDSAGNTTAAIGKGFAIGSATLVGFALYGAFLHSCYTFGSVTKGDISFDDPMIFTSLLFGAMIPYIFSALTMKSVGLAAEGMILEVQRQLREKPGILAGTTKPDYERCVQMSTQASLKEMVWPGLLVTMAISRSLLLLSCSASYLGLRLYWVSCLGPLSQGCRWQCQLPTPAGHGTMPKSTLKAGT